MKPETVQQIAMVNKLSELSGKYNFAFLSIPNEGFMLASVSKPGGTWGGIRKFMFALLNILKKMGLTPGAPDLIILWNGRAFFIEVKTDAGKLSPVQKKVHAWFRRCGCPVSVCRTLDAMLEQLYVWGIIDKLEDFV